MLVLPAAVCVVDAVVVTAVVFTFVVHAYMNAAAVVPETTSSYFAVVLFFARGFAVVTYIQDISVRQAQPLPLFALSESTAVKVPNPARIAPKESTARRKD